MRRRMMAGMQSGIRLVNYLESHRTEYIDTGVACNSFPLQCDIDYQFTSLSSSADVLSGSLGFSNLIGSNNSFALYVQFSSSFAKINVGRDTTSRHVATTLVESNKFTISCDGASGSVRSTPIYNANTLLLFGRWPESGTTKTLSYPAAAKIFSAKYTVNNVLVRDFVPAVIGGVGCMYDRVTKQPFYNLGTGAFTWG